MNTDNQNIRRLAILIFTIGVLVGIFFFGTAIWADLEASMFDVSIPGDVRLDTLSCPQIISSSEKGIVSFTLTNTLDREVKPRVWASVSDGFITDIRRLDTTLTIAPGETKKFEFEVSAEDAVWQYFIFTRVYVFRASSLPSRDGYCGMLVADLADSGGKQIVIMLWLASLLSMWVGLGVWVIVNRPLIGRKLLTTWGMFWLSLLVLLGMVLGAMGSWLAGLLVFVLCVLLILGLLTTVAGVS